MLTAFVDTGNVQKVSNSWRAGKQKDDALDEGPGSGNAVDPESRLAHRSEALRSMIRTGPAVMHPAYPNHGRGYFTARNEGLLLIDWPYR